jgi:Flp pilus assembly protein TadG
MLPVKRTTRKRGERGNALIEFAMMSTVLMGMTLGVADFGRIFAMGNKTSNAAAAGAAYAALSPAHYTDLGGIEDAARSELGSVANATFFVDRTCRCTIGGLPVSCAEDPDVTACPTGQTRKTYVEVKVSVPFRSMSGLPMVPGLTSVKGRAIVRVE